MATTPVLCNATCTPSNFKFKQLGDGTSNNGYFFYPVYNSDGTPLRYYSDMTETNAGVESGRFGLLMKGDQAANRSAHAKAYNTASKRANFTGLKAPVSKSPSPDSQQSTANAGGEAFPVRMTVKTTATGQLSKLCKTIGDAFYKQYHEKLANLEASKPSKAEYEGNIEMKVPATVYHAFISGDEDMDIERFMGSSPFESTVSFVVTGVSVKKVYDTDLDGYAHIYSVKFKLDGIYAVPHAASRKVFSQQPENPVEAAEMPAFVARQIREVLKSGSKQKGKKRGKAPVEAEEEDGEIAAAIEADLEDSEIKTRKKKKPASDTQAQEVELL